MIGPIHVRAAGFLAPGIDNLSQLHAHLDGAETTPSDDWRPPVASVAPRQRRRFSQATLLGIAAAEQIAGHMPPDGGWVFASGLGEGDTLNTILSALRQPEIMIQPVKFQNAVHNAAQGQWSILAGATGPATSIAARYGTVGAGLLKAVLQVALERLTVGLVVFDAPLPDPLHEKWSIDRPMAAALALSPEASSDDLAVWSVELVRTSAIAAKPAMLATPLADSSNPIAAILPLLASLREPAGRETVIGLSDGSALQVRGADAR